MQNSQRDKNAAIKIVLVTLVYFVLYIITGIHVRKQAMYQYLQDRNYDFSVIEEIRVSFGLIPGYPVFGSILVTFTDIEETCLFSYQDGRIRMDSCYYTHKKNGDDLS